MCLNAAENTKLNLRSRNANVFDKQLDMLQIRMPYKHLEEHITSKMKKQKNDSLNTKKPTQRITRANSTSALINGVQQRKMLSLSGQTEKPLQNSMCLRNKKREKQESNMLLTTLSRYKERTYAGCMLNQIYRLSLRKRTCKNSTSLVEDIVPYSLETRRLRIKSRSIKTLDMEYAFLNHQGSSAGSATVARSTASVESWLTTPTGASMVGNSTDIGTGGNYTTPGWTSGGSILAPTDSSVNGTLTVAHLKAVIASCWDAGGMPGIIMCGSSLKQGISAFAGIATIYREAGTTAKGTAIVGAADLYISDFGEHRVVPNRFCKSNQVLVLDMDYWSVAYLRPVRQIEIARTGAADKRFIDVEYALVANNPQSSGKISSATKLL